MRKVIMVPLVGIALLTLMWVLVACTPLPGQINWHDPAVRDLACASVIDTDLEQVFQDPSAQSVFVFWTWHINFRAFGPQNPETSVQYPYACFRVYGRPTLSEHFQAIDGGGIYVPGCETVGTVDFGLHELPHSSLSDPLSVTTPITTGVVTFTNGSYIHCTNMPFNQLAQRAVITDLGSQELHYAVSQLINQPTQENKKFTIVTAGQAHVDNNVVNPVLGYQPLTSSTQVSVMLALPTDATGRSSSISATIGVTTYVPQQGSSPLCMFADWEEDYWWVDFAKPGKLGFVKRPILSGTQPQYDTCASQPISQPQSITFWMGPADIYIGCEPDGVGGCRSGFHGRLYEVLIDPCDSKPQRTT